MKKAIMLLVFASVVFVAAKAAATKGEHVAVNLLPRDDSGVVGKVWLDQSPQGGTDISLLARGLIPGAEYLSVYYANHTCSLEPNSEAHIIGVYTAGANGLGTVAGQIAPDLADVNSVSVRRAGDFGLVACADVHPIPYPPPYP